MTVAGEVTPEGTRSLDLSCGPRIIAYCSAYGLGRQRVLRLSSGCGTGRRSGSDLQRMRLGCTNSGKVERSVRADRDVTFQRNHRRDLSALRKCQSVRWVYDDGSVRLRQVRSGRGEENPDLRVFPGFAHYSAWQSYGTYCVLTMELRAALIIAGKRIRKLQFGRRNDDPVLVHLRDALRQAQSVRLQFGQPLTSPPTPSTDP
jgi:hypothetical protein